ncbi:membrane hypothetical protein [Azospirillaceae bacterium]
MRKLIIVALVALIGLLPVMVPTGAQAQAQSQQQAVAKTSDHRLLAVGAGAILGIVFFNMLTYPLGSVPFAGAPLSPTPVDIALGSRLVAAATAGGGALIAHYLYGVFGN